jgi:hypothetical protein
VAGIHSEQYLTEQRLRLKAVLGATFAVISPDQVFTPLNLLLREIPWEQYRNIQSSFQHLEEI